MTKRSELASVQSHNWHDNGAHGEVDPAVMEDIGFTPFDRFEEVASRADAVEGATLRESVIEQAGHVATSSELTSDQQNANARNFDQTSPKSPSQILRGHYP